MSDWYKSAAQVEADAAAAEHTAAKAARARDYAAEADPLFMQAHRGEATLDEWREKVAEIRARHPYPDEAASV